MDFSDERLISLCRKLIQLPSLSGHEAAAARLISQTMSEYGYDSVTIDRYGSVLGRIRGNRPGKTILLDGHLDTTPVSQPARWYYDPYGGTVEEGKLYGSGASDMKGGVAAMVTAAAAFAASCKKDFAGELCVACTVQEECFEGIAARAISAAVHPDAVIICEATGMRLALGQRGRAELVVETEGIPCHSANPEKGSNAVYAMLAVVEAIRSLPRPEHPVLGSGILELTDILSAPYPGSSVVPGFCRVTYDRRLLVGETRETVLAQIQSAIALAREKFPKLKARAFLAVEEDLCWTGESIEAERFFPAWLLPPDHPLVLAALQGLERADIIAPLSHFSFCTNGSHYCGEAGIPTIGFGPSRESLSHVVDEFIELSQLTRAARGYEGILARLLR